MISEIFRLKALGLSTKAIARTLDVSKNTVKKYLATKADDVSMPTAAKVYQAPWARLVDWKEVKGAVDRGITLQHYWEEKLAASSEPELSAVTSISFWREFKRRFPLVPLDLHKLHPPGERCEADHKGDAPRLGYTNIRTGDFISCRLFGVVLCFSQLFYAEATHTEQQPDFLLAFQNGFRYFGGVPKTAAIDNARVGVTKASRYDPDFNPEFARFADHFGTAELAMRPGKPKDKNLIENHLGVFWRWVRADLKTQRFFSLVELNRYLKVRLDQFNLRVQRKYGLSRREKFEAGENEKLLPLPEVSYEVASWKSAKLHPDCHVQLQYNFFSAPWQLRGKELTLRVTASTVEIFSGLERVAIHPRPAQQRGLYVTEKSHLPEHHQALQEFTPRRAINMAAEIGPNIHQIVSSLLHKSKHPLQYLRRVQGILRLAHRYSKADLEASALSLVELGIELPRLDDVEAIIRSLRLERPKERVAARRKENPNLRGQKSWSEYN